MRTEGKHGNRVRNAETIGGRRRRRCKRKSRGDKQQENKNGDDHNENDVLSREIWNFTAVTDSFLRCDTVRFVTRDCSEPVGAYVPDYTVPISVDPRLERYCSLLLRGCISTRFPGAPCPTLDARPHARSATCHRYLRRAIWGAGVTKTALNRRQQKKKQKNKQERLPIWHPGEQSVLNMKQNLAEYYHPLTYRPVIWAQLPSCMWRLLFR
jgi:hypothetical protein